MWMASIATSYAIVIKKIIWYSSSQLVFPLKLMSIGTVYFPSICNLELKWRKQLWKKGKSWYVASRCRGEKDSQRLLKTLKYLQRLLGDYLGLWETPRDSWYMLWYSDRLSETPRIPEKLINTSRDTWKTMRDT